MSKANNTKAIIFTVTLLSVMVMLIAGTIFYVYKDPVISETVAPEQTVETTAETKAVREKRISVYGTSDIQGKIIDSSSGDKMTYQYRLAYMAKTFSDARNSAGSCLTPYSSFRSSQIFFTANSAASSPMIN